MSKLIEANEQRRELARSIRQLSLPDFRQALEDEGIYRAFILYENGQFQLSHPQILKPVQAFLELSQDFACHEGVFIGREDGLDSIFWAFVHDTRRGLAQGGLRFHHYDNLGDVLVDGLRLSQGMTRKNALAGLNWGGGKGIMTLPESYQHPSAFEAGPERQSYFEAYGRFVASLGGIYYTAEDVGTNTPDMKAIQSQNRFTTCIPTSHGGSGNPSSFTARGVLRAMQAAWQFLTGSDQLYRVRVAVQGTGNVGAPLIRFLDDLGAEVYVTDVNHKALQELKAERPRLQIVSNPDSIYDVDADIFAPCAIGAVVNVNTIPRLKVKLICGAANNILKEPEADAERLRERDIAMIPDFVCNRMGIVNCADEWQGYLPEDVRFEAERVFPDTLRVFKYARSRYTTTTEAAIDLADVAASDLHPILGHRGRRIIDHLVQRRWHLTAPDEPPQEHDARVEPAFVPALDEPALRLRWEQRQSNRRERPKLAATPITTAYSPHLGSLLSALMVDFKARWYEHQQGLHPSRILGAEHGGLALQIAVEQAQPYEREEIGRSEFVSLCRDHYHQHDAEIREQINHLGIPFDPDAWISPMEGPAKKAIEYAYDFLKRAQMLYTLEAIAYHCPRCESIRVASDVIREHHHREEAYALSLRSSSGETLEMISLAPEFLLGSVALAVHPDSEWAHLQGQRVQDPLSQNWLPVVISRFARKKPELICPLVHKRHEKIAQEHQLALRIQLFDRKGKVCVPDYAGLSQEQARAAVVQKLGGKIRKTQGQWQIDVPYCGRCESRVLPRYGDQLFVHIEAAVAQLKRLIREDEVSFSQDIWKTRMLEILNDLTLWCISRQYWWGNKLSDRPEEVLSTWFTLAIWALHGAGWPENPKPDPIEEVFVDAELLFRWIITSQLAAIILTGQPVFKHIHVHGTLHVQERSLKEREGVEKNLWDEERFLYHSVRRPMRNRLGNVIEPMTLIQRFGADALRLGYALSLDSNAPDIVLLSEDRLRLARRTLSKTISKVTGLFHLVRPTESPGPARLLDHWLAHLATKFEQQTQADYEDNQFSNVAQALIDANDKLVRYINTVVESRKEQEDYGAARASVLIYLQALKKNFGPLCPYVFEGLEIWARQRLLGEEESPNAQSPQVQRVAQALAEPESVEPFPPELQSEQPELQRFFGSEWMLGS